LRIATLMVRTRGTTADDSAHEHGGMNTAESDSVIEDREATPAAPSSAAASAVSISVPHVFQHHDRVSTTN
jgi:hypothetical protein